MDKRLDFLGVTDSGSAVVRGLPISHTGIIKTAALRKERLHPDLTRYIDDITPSKDKLYSLIYALGAGEYWGCNLNSDWVSRAVLSNRDPDNGYLSFLKAGVFLHHKNKDITQSFGRHVASIYNPEMHRVELLQEIDRAKAREFGAQDVVDRLDNGENPPVSMGLRTSYDICSICGNKCYSAKAEDYCQCIQLFKGKILADGRQVYMINPFAKFFDMSYVLIGADPSAFAVAKVAGLKENYAQDRFELHSSDYGKAKTAALRRVIKEASDKRTLVMESFQKSEKSLPRETLNSLGQLPLENALSSAAGAGIILRPHEFQRVMLVRMKQPDMADELDNSGGVFCPHISDQPIPIGLGADRIKSSLILGLSPHVEERSILDPFLTARVHRYDHLNVDVPENYFREPTLDVISRAYDGYRLALLQKIDELIENGALQESTIVTKLIPDTVDLSNKLRKTASAENKIVSLGVLPVTYLLTHIMQKLKGDDRTVLRKFIEDHPNISVSVLRGLAKVLST